VAVARALVNRPRLILADEPTAALDSKSTTKVLDQMRKLTAQGSTILIVTHDVKILSLADRIVSMAEGRIKSNELVTESIRLCMYLSRCPAFATLKPEALANLASTMVPERFEAGDVVIRQDDEGDRFYLINQGKVDVLRDDGQGPQKVATLEEGQFFGETSLMEDKPRNATVVATTPLDVYTIDKPRFRQAMESTAPIREQILKVFYQRQ
jgi:energy-coupling factor transporter ATP-binding protein EcfA2